LLQSEDMMLGQSSGTSPLALDFPIISNPGTKWKSGHYMFQTVIPRCIRGISIPQYRALYCYTGFTRATVLTDTEMSYRSTWHQVDRGVRMRNLVPTGSALRKTHVHNSGIGEDRSTCLLSSTQARVPLWEAAEHYFLIQDSPKRSVIRVGSA
jgi:hypothetical protein